MDYLFLAIFFSILPDLDVFLTPLKKVIKSNYLEHRGGSHSYIVGIIISFTISVIRSLIIQQPFIFVWIIGFSFYSLHVSMDLLTTTKIPYLFPLSKKEYSFYIEKAGSFFTFVNSIIFLILPLFIFRLFSEIFFIQLYINIYTSFFLIYYLYRILSKLLVSRTLDTNQKYLPGLLPFYFKLYNYDLNGNEIVTSIEKKSHFSKKTEEIIIKATLSSQEKIFYDEAWKLNKKNYYFAKWTLIPTVIREEGIFTVRFFFLETMMRTRNMYIQYNFDLDTQVYIGVEQGSGHIQNKK